MATNLFALGSLLTIFAMILPPSVEKNIVPTTKTTMSSKGICQLPVKSGNCMAYMPRWYYSNKIKTCQQFIYGGCDGNQNNFVTKAACLLVCRSGSQQRLKPVVPITTAATETRKRVGITQLIQHHPSIPTPNTDISLSNKPCEVQKRKAIASNATGEFVPECDHQGFYKQKQCWTMLNNKTHCWCVNHQGNKIGDVKRETDGKETCNPFPNKNTEAPIQSDGPCNQVLRIYSTPMMKKVMSKLHIPHCDDKGNFVSLQCHKNKCWCVDIYSGSEIQNTFGYKGSVKCTTT